MQLRAERDPKSDGRVYLILVLATDTAGNQSEACCTVTVPRSQSGKNLTDVAQQAAEALDHCRRTGEPPPGFELLAGL